MLIHIGSMYIGFFLFAMDLRPQLEAAYTASGPSEMYVCMFVFKFVAYFLIYTAVCKYVT